MTTIQGQTELPDLVSALESKFRNDIFSAPARSIHASQIGHPCKRKLVYAQVSTAREPHDVKTQMIFALGRILEESSHVDLVESFQGNEDVQIVRERCNLPPNRWNIGGQLDFSIAVRSGRDWKKYPIEFKTCSDSVFSRIESVQDMMDDKLVYIRQYPAQIQIYIHFTGAEKGCFLLRNKVTGEYRQINVPADRNHIKELLQKAELVNDSIAAYKGAGDNIAEQEKALPVRIPFSGDICMRCEFRAVCCPDMVNIPGIENRIWDTDLNALCAIMVEKEKAADEYEQAKKKIDAHCKSIGAEMGVGQNKTIILNGFTITLKTHEGSSYDVPMDIKKQYSKKITITRKTIDAIDDHKEKHNGEQ